LLAVKFTSVIVFPVPNTEPEMPVFDPLETMVKAPKLVLNAVKSILSMPLTKLLIRSLPKHVKPGLDHDDRSPQID
jgi:hypothetical protein